MTHSTENTQIYSSAEALNTFAHELLSNGFRILVPVEPKTWLHFEKDGKIGYVQYDSYGFSFSTRHKACRECGTGYGIHSEVGEPTIKHAEDCLIFAPHWGIHLNAVKKYTSLEDYKGVPVNAIIPSVIIEPTI